MFSWWVCWRFVKFLGICVFALGLAGAIAHPQRRARRWCARWLASAGMLLTWTAGYGLMKLNGTSFSAPWISLSLLASIVATWGALTSADSVEEPPRLATAAVGAGFFASVGLMVVRFQGVLGLVAAVGLPLLAAWASLRASRSRAPEIAEPPDRTARDWFIWVARAEGLSLLLLFGLFMPVKYAARIELDGGQGWFGWVHGMMVIWFGLALAHVAKTWTWSRIALAAGASMVPFGTFVFERRALAGSDE